MSKGKATPHNSQLMLYAPICLHLFRQPAQKCSPIHPVFAVLFVLSDEKSDCNVGTQNYAVSL
ncbi:MAG: hypothetical protein PHG19_06530 [Anaerotignum sp.]|nr:hypothetical protein [Anaerotignum sp.]